MRQKILLSLLLLFVVFFMGTMLAMIYLRETTHQLSELVKAHEIDEFQRSLAKGIQRVQSDLQAVAGTRSDGLGSIVESVSELEKRAESCGGCHHAANVAKEFDRLRELVGNYEAALSHSITATGDPRRLQALKDEATRSGESILRFTERMSLSALGRISKMTKKTARSFRNVDYILGATLLVTALMGLLAAIRLSRSITHPVQDLLQGTRAIAAGNLSYKISHRGTSEFRELASNFNRMSEALRSGYQDLTLANDRLYRENLERRKIEQRLRLDEARLEALLDLGAMTDASEQRIAEFVLDHGIRLTNSRSGFVRLVDESGRVTLRHAASIEPETGNGREADSGEPALNETWTWRRTVDERKPVLINAQGHSRPAGTDRQDNPGGAGRSQRVLSVPILDRASVVGVAAVAGKDSEYDEMDQRQFVLLVQGMWQHLQRRRRDEELLRMQKLESLGILAGGIAHDFNNLLTGILGNISLALDRIGADGDLSSLLAAASQATRRAKGLTAQLLTFSRGGAPVRETVSMGDLVRETTTFVTRGSKVKCRFRVQEDLFFVEIDVGQIAQVLNNLVINACDAMPDGGTLEIVCRSVTSAEETLPIEEDKCVVISIADQGVGIKPEHLQKVFEPYFSTKKRGSGLGLSASTSIVQAHGGHISVESQLGAGTIFHVYLPASSKEPVATDVRNEEKVTRGKGGRILVMDDDELVLEVCQGILEYLGYQVVTATDGAEALERYEDARQKGRPFDAVVFDLTIPGGMGGQEAIRRLRLVDPSIKAIVTSGYSSDPVLAEHERYGFNGRVVKPYNVHDLGSAMEELLGG